MRGNEAPASAAVAGHVEHRTEARDPRVATRGAAPRQGALLPALLPPLLRSKASRAPGRRRFGAVVAAVVGQRRRGVTFHGGGSQRGEPVADRLRAARRQLQLAAGVTAGVARLVARGVVPGAGDGLDRPAAHGPAECGTVRAASSDRSRIGVLLDLSWLFFTKIDRRKWVSSFLELLSPNLQ